MTNENAQINLAYFLYNGSMAEAIKGVWGGTHLEQHLRDKLSSIIHRNGLGYTDVKSIMDFIMELGNDHKASFFRWVNENYDAGFRLKD